MIELARTDCVHLWGQEEIVGLRTGLCPGRGYKDEVVNDVPMMGKRWGDPAELRALKHRLHSATLSSHKAVKMPLMSLIRSGHGTRGKMNFFKELTGLSGR